MDQLLFLVVTLITAGAGAYFGAYLKEKGKSYATREDIAHLTRLAEEVRSDIASKSWVEQRRWDLKREIYFRLLDALDAIGTVHAELDHVLNANKQPPPELMKDWNNAMHALFQGMTQAHVFLASETLNAFYSMARSYNVVADSLRETPSSQVPYSERVKPLRKMRDIMDELLKDVIRNAKQDLMLKVERQGEPS